MTSGRNLSVSSPHNREVATNDHTGNLPRRGPGRRSWLGDRRSAAGAHRRAVLPVARTYQTSRPRRRGGRCRVRRFRSARRVAGDSRRGPVVPDLPVGGELPGAPATSSAAVHHRPPRRTGLLRGLGPTGGHAGAGFTRAAQTVPLAHVGRCRAGVALPVLPLARVGLRRPHLADSRPRRHVRSHRVRDARGDRLADRREMGTGGSPDGTGGEPGPGTATPRAGRARGGTGPAREGDARRRVPRHHAHRHAGGRAVGGQGRQPGQGDRRHDPHSQHPHPGRTPRARGTAALGGRHGRAGGSA